jgi:hypothetical protein
VETNKRRNREIMTPKEKTEELVNKYIGLNSGKLSDYSRIEFPTAKQCALIAVDEIINSINPFGMFLGKDYWQEVKQEIENL